MSPRANALWPADRSRSDACRPMARAAVVERAQLGEVGVRLLEVVAEDLLVLAGAVAVHLVGPCHEALVQLGPMPLQEPGVGRVADQDVLEGVRRAGGHDRRVRLHEPPPHEAAQILGDGRPARVRERARRRPPRGRPAPRPTRCRRRRAGRRRAGRAGPRGGRGSSAGRRRRRPARPGSSRASARGRAGFRLRSRRSSGASPAAPRFPPGRPRAPPPRRPRAGRARWWFLRPASPSRRRPLRARRAPCRGGGAGQPWRRGGRPGRASSARPSADPRTRRRAARGRRCS